MSDGEPIPMSGAENINNIGANKPPEGPRGPSEHNVPMLPEKVGGNITSTLPEETGKVPKEDRLVYPENVRPGESMLEALERVGGKDVLDRKSTLLELEHDTGLSQEAVREVISEIKRESLVDRVKKMAEEAKVSVPVENIPATPTIEQIKQAIRETMEAQKARETPEPREEEKAGKTEVRDKVTEAAKTVAAEVTDAAKKRAVGAVVGFGEKVAAQLVTALGAAFIATKAEDIEEKKEHTEEERGGEKGVVRLDPGVITQTRALLGEGLSVDDIVGDFEVLGYSKEELKAIRNLAERINARTGKIQILEEKPVIPQQEKEDTGKEKDDFSNLSYVELRNRLTSETDEKIREQIKAEKFKRAMEINGKEFANLSQQSLEERIREVLLVSDIDTVDRNLNQMADDMDNTAKGINANEYSRDKKLEGGVYDIVRGEIDAVRLDMYLGLSDAELEARGMDRKKLETDRVNLDKTRLGLVTVRAPSGLLKEELSEEQLKDFYARKIPGAEEAYRRRVAEREARERAEKQPPPPTSGSGLREGEYRPEGWLEPDAVQKILNEMLFSGRATITQEVWRAIHLMAAVPETEKRAREMRIQMVLINDVYERMHAKPGEFNKALKLAHQICGLGADEVWSQEKYTQLMNPMAVQAEKIVLQQAGILFESNKTVREEADKVERKKYNDLKDRVEKHLKKYYGNVKADDKEEKIKRTAEKYASENCHYFGEKKWKIADRENREAFWGEHPDAGTVKDNVILKLAEIYNKDLIEGGKIPEEGSPKYAEYVKLEKAAAIGKALVYHSGLPAQLATTSENAAVSFTEYLAANINDEVIIRADKGQDTFPFVKRNPNNLLWFKKELSKKEAGDMGRGNDRFNEHFVEGPYPGMTWHELWVPQIKPQDILTSRLMVKDKYNDERDGKTIEIKNDKSCVLDYIADFKADAKADPNADTSVEVLPTKQLAQPGTFLKDINDQWEQTVSMLRIVDGGIISPQWGKMDQWKEFGYTSYIDMIATVVKKYAYYNKTLDELDKAEAAGDKKAKEEIQESLDQWFVAGVISLIKFDMDAKAVLPPMRYVRVASDLQFDTVANFSPAGHKNYRITYHSGELGDWMWQKVPEILEDKNHQLRIAQKVVLKAFVNDPDAREYAAHVAHNNAQAETEVKQRFLKPKGIGPFKFPGINFMKYEPKFLLGEAASYDRRNITPLLKLRNW